MQVGLDKMEEGRQIFVQEKKNVEKEIQKLENIVGKPAKLAYAAEDSYVISNDGLQFKLLGTFDLG